MRKFEADRKQEAPKTTIGNNQLADLSFSEKQDLVMFSGTPAYTAILKLMETMLVEARDEAVLADPANPAAQLAALNTAHAMGKLFLGVKEKLNFLVEEHLGILKQRDAEAAMDDQERFEAIVLDPINQGR